ncbi:MAG: 16S rRNA (adenine(1518)-N(6)/adenine(1519)-N(6))-dimethyltransferase RsmA [Gammaproteobacteria bacterium]|nr:16S rRNA (adenine(1518)-N(6)/adenine(1519)-N(6))-dimethyltransferase RsmA [Gammaproteobacteria bacterium]
MNTPPPRKRLGQHFLHDQNILDKIVRAIDPRAGEHFVEIGPGRGALTGPLLDRGVNVDAIELDRALAARLPAQFPAAALTVHQGDALKFDFTQLGTRDLRLVGNLPYNISTPLLFHFLDHSTLFRDIHVMLQKEVVERMTASAGTKAYGRLTVALAARCRIEALFVIRPGSFRPPPQVDSAFVRLVPDAARFARIDSPQLFEQIVNAAFSQRRKQLANSLRTMIGPVQLVDLGIDPSRRAETLTVEDYVQLANECAARQQSAG